MTVAQKRLGLIFLLVGPSGVGKNALMTSVLPHIERLRQLPTATSRPMRPTEAQGREHLFVSEEEFRRMIAQDELLEWQEVHGKLYGIPRSTVEQAIHNQQDMIADIEVLGATYMRSIYPDNTILIFISAPSTDVLRERLRTRGESEAEIENRMRRVDMEMQFAPLCDYLIVNDDKETASDTLWAIVLAEHSRRALLNLRVENSFPRHKFTSAITIIPVYGDEVLSRDVPPYFVNDGLHYGELPQEAAMRLLARTFGFEPSLANLNSSTWKTEPARLPITLSHERQEPFAFITFEYVYTMTERITPPEGWSWRSVETAGLAPSTISTIMALRQGLGIDQPLPPSPSPYTGRGG